jgi:hypothetical protein
MRAMTVAVVVPMRMVVINAIVIEVVMMMRMAVRPPPVAVIVDVLVRVAVALRLARAGLALLEDHFGLTASANAAHQAISISRTFTSSPQAIPAKRRRMHSSRPRSP